ncbi:FAS-associated death domain protein [Aethina tumida]|uniref:FAS-associated death domain protein n=1 Tax=Aethina tumida TaxID=116153 RepID=UPI00096AF352|nr:FAS-associated death domain protein [Aethina tumida]
MAGTTSLEYKYQEMRNKLTNTQCSRDTLNSVKMSLWREINSKRDLDRIETMNDLVTVLEKRLCLHSGDTHLMDDIADLMGISILTIRQNPQPSSPGHPSIFQEVNRDILIRVQDKICNEIGKYWKEFARQLGISEGKIDELDAKFKSISEMTRQVLQYHIQTCEKNRLRTTICDALMRAKRNDLRKEIEHIFDTHHLIYPYHF